MWRSMTEGTTVVKNKWALRYGNVLCRAEEAPPELRQVRLRPLAEEVADLYTGLDLARNY